MICRRIIPCLDIKNGKTVKGVNFQNLVALGDPVEMAKKYTHEGADELVILDITATLEEREVFLEIVEQIARQINIPLCVGGGINSVDQARKVLRAGADKIAINSAALMNPDLINQLSDTFGKQCVVVAIDAELINEQWFVKAKSATYKTNLHLFDWAYEVQKRGAGEILFTSIDHDGTNSGYALAPLAFLAEKLSIPIIASGGAGSKLHFDELFRKTNVSGALAAGVFHRELIRIPELKEFLFKNQINVRLQN